MGNWMAATSIGSALICSGIAISKNFTVQGAEQARMEGEIAAQMQSETKAQHRSRLLKVVANEWKNARLTTIAAFDKNGKLYKVPTTQKDIPKTKHSMSIGMKLEGFDGNPSISIYDPVSRMFAAIGEINGQLEILFIYSKEEVEKS